MSHAASSSSSTAPAGMAARPAIALITGGSRGLGRNAALHVARSGTAVILTYRSQAAEAQAVVAEIEALGRLTAELHDALASDPADPEFAPRPTGPADLERWREAARAQLTAALDRLPARRASLPI